MKCNEKNQQQVILNRIIRFASQTGHREIMSTALVQTLAQFVHIFFLVPVSYRFFAFVFIHLSLSISHPFVFYLFSSPLLFNGSYRCCATRINTAHTKYTQKKAPWTHPNHQRLAHLSFLELLSIICLWDILQIITSIAGWPTTKCGNEQIKKMDRSAFHLFSVYRTIYYRSSSKCSEKELGTGKWKTPVQQVNQTHVDLHTPVWF